MDYKMLINDYIDSNASNMISDLRSLIKIPSVKSTALPNMPFGEKTANALAVALDLCKSYGLVTKNFDNYVGTADFTSENQSSNEPQLGILCHLDVVPEGKGWSVPPFDLTEIDGKLLGRGTIDDKGPFIAALYAVKAVKELNIPLKSGVRLIMGTDEENGSSDLAYYIKKQELPPMLFTPDGSYPVINIEKGMLRAVVSTNMKKHANGVIIHSIKGGNAINAVPEYAEAEISGIDVDSVKNILLSLDIDAEFDIYQKYNILHIIAKGISAHASTPNLGKNAISALLMLLAGVTNEYPAVTALSKLFPFYETDGESCGIKCSDDVSGDLTAVLSIIEFDGYNLNGKVDIRFPVCKTSAEILNSLKGVCRNDEFCVSTLLAFEPHHVPEDSDFIKSLLEVYEDMTGEKGYCVAIGGGTYVHDTDCGVAFGAEFPNEENNMHSADEFIKKDSLLLNAKIYANAIVKLLT